MTREQTEELPAFIHAFARVINTIHWFFDRIYHSRFNPLYRSGTLTIGLLFVLLVTGLYLILFYKVGAPFESVEALQSTFLGSWMRAVHRYATDLVILTMFFHVLQMLALGKTWGPRLLAWITGCILCGAMFLSAWTGYVMVWDTHGQAFALAGAEILQVFPFLKDSVAQAFSGSREVLGSFFFMNLFLHVAIPLGMLAGLWVHTARISRTVWFPSKPIYTGVVVSLCLLGLVWPAPLPGKADLLQLVSVIPTDFFVGFWLPFWYHGSGLVALIFWVVLIAVSFLLPIWWRPKTLEAFKKSSVDAENCLGCGQCARDCPHEAITMKKRDGKIPLYSFVDPALCVSCGICAASCDDLAIGPETRKGDVQFNAAEEYISIRGTKKGDDVSGVLAFACECNGDALEKLTAFGKELSVDVKRIECCGNLHADVVERYLESTEGVFVWGCPERNCANRDGVQLLRARLYENRHPTLKRRTDKRRVRLFPASPWEFSEVKHELEQFTKDLSNLDARTIESDEVPVNWSYYARSTAFSVLMMALIAIFSALPLGVIPDTGMLRLSFVSPKLSKEHCRPLTPEEQSAQPIHMKKREICEQVDTGYKVTVTVDGKALPSSEYHHGGLRADRPVLVNQDVPLIPGTRQIEVHLEQLAKEGIEARRYSLKQDISVSPGRVYLVDFDEISQKMLFKVSEHR